MFSGCGSETYVELEVAAEISFQGSAYLGAACYFGLVYTYDLLSKISWRIGFAFCSIPKIDFEGLRVDLQFPFYILKAILEPDGPEKFICKVFYDTTVD